MGEDRGFEIRELVRKLSDLSENQKAVLQILPYGLEAVEPLAELLLSGPALHAEPRCLAAEALGLIGGPDAIDALCDVLFVNDVHGADASLKLSEEVVRNRAAEELGRLADPDAIEPLLAALVEFHLAGAAEALGRLRVRRAIPYLVERLEDDFAREKARIALMNFGDEAVAALARTLHVKKMGFDEETPLSVNRRVAALELLAQIGARSLADEIHPFLSDRSERVRRAAAHALMTVGNTCHQGDAARVLQEFLNHEDWMVRDECREALEDFESRTSSG
jgi:HEAT repeat protein